MSSAYDIDAINRMIGLGNDTDAITAVLPDLDEHEKTQRPAEPWLPAEQPIRVTPVQRVVNRSPVTILPPSSPVKFTQVTQSDQKVPPSGQSFFPSLSFRLSHSLAFVSTHLGADVSK